MSFVSGWGFDGYLSWHGGWRTAENSPSWWNLVSCVEREARLITYLIARKENLEYKQVFPFFGTYLGFIPIVTMPLPSTVAPLCLSFEAWVGYRGVVNLGEDWCFLVRFRL